MYTFIGPKSSTENNQNMASYLYKCEQSKSDPRRKFYIENLAGVNHGTFFVEHYLRICFVDQILWYPSLHCRTLSADLIRAECSIRKNHPIYTNKNFFAKHVLWIRSAKLVLHFSAFTPKNMFCA